MSSVLAQRGGVQEQWTHRGSLECPSVTPDGTRSRLAATLVKLCVRGLTRIETSLSLPSVIEMQNSLIDPMPNEVEPSAGAEQSSAVPSGCIVVLEPGAKWPERAFAEMPHRDSVVVVNKSAAETTDHFFTRLSHQFARLRASGVLLRTVLVACAAAGMAQTIDRDELVTHVQAQVQQTAAVVFVGPCDA